MKRDGKETRNVEKKNTRIFQERKERVLKKQLT